MGRPVGGLALVRLLALILACGALLSACITMGKAPPPATPDWVIGPPTDTDDALYGVGDGPDVGAATRLALRDVASKLRVTVSGAVKSQISESNGRVDSSASSSLMSEVQKTEFKQYSLVQSSASPSGVYALVKVDRRAFLADTRARIQRTALLTDQLLGDVKSAGPLERYLALQRARPLLDSQLGLYLLFKSGDMTSDDNAHLGRIQRAIADADAAGSRVVLLVRAGRDDGDVRDMVLGRMAEQGLRTTEQAGQAHGTLDVNVKAQSSSFGQDTVVRLPVTLVLKDNKGAVVASREHLATGASRTDARMARQQAVMQLHNNLRAMGLLDTLGIQPLSPK